MPTKRGPARKSTPIKRKHRFRKKWTHHATPVQMKELLDQAKALLDEWLVNYDEVEVQVLADLEGKLVTLEEKIDEIEAKLDHATHGLAALKAEIDANETKIDRKVSPMLFLSVIDDIVDLPAAAADRNLPNVVISGIPSGATLVKVLVFVKVRAIENTSAVGVNAIQGAQNIRIKKSTGAWGVDDVIAIPLTDNMWTLAASTREFGDVIGGDDAHDVKGEVDENATYNLRFEDANVDLDFLRLNDVQVIIKVWFY